MVDATQFFEHPARDICTIYSQVFGVFTNHFTTFAILASLQALVHIPVLLVFGFVAYEAFSDEVDALFQTTSTGDSSLYDDAIYGGDSWEMNGVTLLSALPTILLSALPTFLGLFFAYTIAIICIFSTFQGAFIRAASEVFAGHPPHWRACLGHGWKKMCSVICFNILCLLAIGVTGTLLFFVALYPQGDSVNVGLAFLSILIFFVAFIVFASGMTAGLASIVVENKGPAAAIRRSWNLCKSKIGFIFCCVFCFYAVEFICKFVINNILSAIAASITDSGSTLAVSMAASWLMGLLLGPLNAILDPTIYFSLRIQKEGLTLDVLQEDLALFDNSIEVQTGSGTHSELVVPIDKATAV